MSTGFWLTQPRHLRLGGRNGTSTACGLGAIQHRAIRYDDNPLNTSCRNCRRWIKSNPHLFAKDVTPR